METVEGLPYRSSGTIQFFCTQAIGIMLEDGIQAVYRLAYGMKRDSVRSSSLGARLIGYCWVVAFLAWSTPVWLYPRLYANEGQKKDEYLPFSIVKRLGL